MTGIEVCGHVGGGEEHCPCVDHLVDECARCHGQIDGTPIQDAEQVAWLGDFAPKFCDDECLNAYAEANS